jgi:drug/metabolite transporter (DMT)-like permease
VLTVALALGAALSYAVSDLLAQRVTRSGASVVSTLTWILATGTAITVPVTAFGGGLPHGSTGLADVGYATAAGAAYVIAYASLVRGLRVGNISLVTPLASLQGAVAAVLAVVLLGEQVVAITVGGLVLAVVGSLLAATAPGSPLPTPESDGVVTGRMEEAPPHASRRRLGTAAGAGWGLLSAATFGTVLVLYGAISSLSPVTAVAVSRAVSFLLILPFAFRFGAHMPRRSRRTALLSGVLEVGGFYLIVAAVTVGPVTIASVLAAQFATFAVILGLVVNRERPRPIQLVGVVCTILAVTILALA